MRMCVFYEWCTYLMWIELTNWFLKNSFQSLQRILSFFLPFAWNAASIAETNFIYRSNQHHSLSKQIEIIYPFHCKQFMSVSRARFDRIQMASHWFHFTLLLLLQLIVAIDYGDFKSAFLLWNLCPVKYPYLCLFPNTHPASMPQSIYWKLNRFFSRVNVDPILYIGTEQQSLTTIPEILLLHRDPLIYGCYICMHTPTIQQPP